MRRRPMKRFRAVALVAIGLNLILSSALSAQQAAAIAGAVRDTSGAVLPGVTVEAASPVLIEKVRTVVTDDQGRYNIVDLRPGVYRVTFTLPGFNTLVREGVALSSGFTAAVNADLPVGALQSSGISAESNADGSVVNMIPKEGSNGFSGSFAGLYTSDRFEASNLNDDLRARGLTTVSKILKIYDTGATLGGPIRKDKLWFFASFREWGNQHLMAGNFWNKTQGSPFYTPDLSHPADRAQWYESKSARVTRQARREP